jgi:hypothetical protein
MKRAMITAVLFGLFIGAAFAQGIAASGSSTELRKKIAEEAVEWKGVPYVYGGSSPSGFDCSGYTQYVYRKVAGIELPRRARDQYAIGVPVAREDAQMGDLFIFDTIGGPSHVGIYLGDGNFSHAASEGSPSGIKVSKISDNYYATKFMIGRSVLPRIEGPRPGPQSSGQASPQGGTQQAQASTQSQQQTPAAQPSKPSGSPGAGSPAQGQAPSQPQKPEIPVSTIGFTIGPRVLKYNDPIPAYAGTKVEFNVMNKSGADGDFELSFVRGDYDSGAYKTLWTGRKSIKDGTYVTTPEFMLDAVDYWQLVVKGADGALRGKRAFKSIPEK